NAIAIGGGRGYLIDRPIAPADRITNPRRGGRPNPPLKPGQHPSGTLLAFDAQTGKRLWQQTEDVFGTQLALSVPHRILLMSYQAVPHKFFKLPSEVGGRIAALHADAGQLLWDRQSDYQTRPMIIGDRVYAQGAAWDLQTGTPIPFDFHRSYGCGQISAGAHMLLFRSATLGYWDLRRPDSLQNFGGVRPGCWINAVPAGGIVLVPEGSSKCVCSYQMQAWIALISEE
ncbi:MAG TPA: hypothetical protein EYP14_08480, partial [Planctomycetaceae bacterium]|nr:hypothetical protein [Planctomycetaceae bacterium]